MRSVLFVSSSLSLALSLAACGGPPPAAAETTPARVGASDGRDRSTASRQDGSSGQGGCALSSVYFDDDSNGLDARARESLARDATCLRGRPSDAVTLVGGADHRDTEEYNFALGDRRARAVQQYLVGAGVEAERVRVRSVGEEWSSGHDAAAMARDRRVEPTPPAGSR
ncbi:MAG: OmpA family protein [Myxococcota bacterium]|nr:OmpA family protein [Myxococcota bacterium]